MSALLLQINNVQALERLLGTGEDGFEMAVRNSVAQAFANRHFPALMKTPEMQEAMNEIKKRGQEMKQVAEKQFNDAIQDELGYFTGSSWSKKFVLGDEAKAQIRIQAKAEVTGIIQEVAGKAVAEMDIPGLVQKAIDEKINAAWQASVDTAVSAKLAEIKRLL